MASLKGHRTAISCLLPRVTTVLKWIELFEIWINRAVLLMMALVVLILTVAFALDIVRDIMAYPTGVITNEQVFGIFGDLLLILIGLELMDSVKGYLKDHKVNVEAILTVAMVALARKAIVVNVKDYQAGAIGLGLLIVALAASRWLLLQRPSRSKPQ
jgi:uncharacterized membrane protein (DUF373 family)